MEPKPNALEENNFSTFIANLKNRKGQMKWVWCWINGLFMILFFVPFFVKEVRWFSRFNRGEVYIFYGKNSSHNELFYEHQLWQYDRLQDFILRKIQASTRQKELKVYTKKIQASTRLKKLEVPITLYYASRVEPIPTFLFINLKLLQYV